LEDQRRQIRRNLNHLKEAVARLAGSSAALLANEDFEESAEAQSGSDEPTAESSPSGADDPGSGDDPSGEDESAQPDQELNGKASNPHRNGAPPKQSKSAEHDSDKRQTSTTGKPTAQK
ncbi:MAG: hypothetical protein ACRDT1_15470, partial [Micromonosporaceae bacterium]